MGVFIRADFLTPYYDITFSQSPDGFKYRRKTDRYLDFSMLPNIPNEETVFFGGKDYLPLLCSLTGETPNRKNCFLQRCGRAGSAGLEFAEI